MIGSFTVVSSVECVTFATILCTVFKFGLFTFFSI